MTRSVLIVGAGIGGLTLAHVLRRAGAQVQVIEKVAAWRPVGAGLILSVNALRVLDQVGLREAAVQAGQSLASVYLTDAAGRPLQTMSHQAYGGAVALHRAALQTVLGRDLEQQVQFGTTVQALRQDRQGVSVTLSDGSSRRFDVVVGADGLHSSVRQLVFGSVPTRYAGYTSWRFVVRSPAPQHAVEMWGRGCRLGFVPLGGGQTYGYVTANAPEGQRGGTPDPASELRARCAQFGGPAPELLARLRPDTSVIHTDIHEVRLRRWVEGRVVLLGDAAHAMTPNLGQGAAMSLEDAWVLGKQLSTSSDVPAALARYTQLRRRRVDSVQTGSRLLGQVGQLEAAGLRALRDMTMRLTPPELTRRSMGHLFEAKQVRHSE